MVNYSTEAPPTCWSVILLLTGSQSEETFFQTVDELRSCTKVQHKMNKDHLNCEWCKMTPLESNNKIMELEISIIGPL